MKETMKEIDWHCKWFSELNTSELYRILQLRSRIFVVEQHCVYLDFDDRDQQALHLFATDGDIVVCGTRILPAGVSYPDCPSIGRVVVDKSYRSMGLGKLLMEKSIATCQTFFGDGPIRIAAQNHLRNFYESLGFNARGDIFDEDGIPHITMER